MSDVHTIDLDTTKAVSAIQSVRRRMVDGARRYAAADKSDPFSFSRAMTHIKNGVSSVSRPGNREYGIPAGVAAYNDADSYMETRKIIAEGRELVFDVVAYRNLCRP